MNEILNKYIEQTNYGNKIRLYFLKYIFGKILSKDIAAANLIGAGILPINELKKESQKVIQNSLNYQKMLSLLIDYSQNSFC